jgi:sulfur-oxidizing protein SoxX
MHGPACQNHFMKKLLLCALLISAKSTSFADENPKTSAGFEIMTSRQLGNCMACHEMPGVDGLVSTLGPSLKGIARKWTRAELMQWVKDARKLNSQTLMPPFGTSEGLTKATPPRAILSDAQISQVVDTLQSWQ